MYCLSDCRGTTLERVSSMAPEYRGLVGNNVNRWSAEACTVASSFMLSKPVDLNGNDSRDEA